MIALDPKIIVRGPALLAGDRVQRKPDPAHPTILDGEMATVIQVGYRWADAPLANPNMIVVRFDRDSTNTVVDRWNLRVVR